MCAVEAQRCVDCVSAVLTRAATLRALVDANIPGPDAPLWTIGLLVDDNDRDFGRWPIGIRLEVVQLLNLGRTTPATRHRRLDSSPACRNRTSNF
jgi:hypothetical protein